MTKQERKVETTLLALKDWAEIAKLVPQMTEQRCQQIDAALTHAVQAVRTVAELESGLKAILKAVRGDEKGECWTIRKWLDKRDIFNDDIQGPQRLTEEACKYLLRQ
jgi:hypothetical protein